MSDQGERPQIIRSRHPDHRCRTPCTHTWCDNSVWVMSGDLWQCPECRKYWMAKMLLMQSGSPVIWTTPSKSKLRRLLKKSGRQL